MFEAYKIGVAISLTDHVSAGLASLTKNFAKTDEQAAMLQKRIEGISRGLKGGLIATGAGIALATMFKPAIEDAMKFERALLRLKDIGGINGQVVSQVRSDALSGMRPRRPASNGAWRFITAADLLLILTTAHCQKQLAEALKRFVNPYRSRWPHPRSQHSPVAAILLSRCL